MTSIYAPFAAALAISQDEKTYNQGYIDGYKGDQKSGSGYNYDRGFNDGDRDKQRDAGMVDEWNDTRVK